MSDVPDYRGTHAAVAYPEKVEIVVLRIIRHLAPHKNTPCATIEQPGSLKKAREPPSDISTAEVTEGLLKLCHQPTCTKLYSGGSGGGLDGWERGRGGGNNVSGNLSWPLSRSSLQVSVQFAQSVYILLHREQSHALSRMWYLAIKASAERCGQIRGAFMSAA